MRWDPIGIAVQSHVPPPQSRIEDIASSMSTRKCLSDSSAIDRRACCTRRCKLALTPILPHGGEAASPATPYAPVFKCCLVARATCT